MRGAAAFPHAYDDLATTALRYLRETGGEDAVVAFAEHRAETLAERLDRRVDRRAPARRPRRGAGRGAVSATATPPPPRRDRTATACRCASTTARSRTWPPSSRELCEAETRAFERVLGTYVQRLATIAHGDGVCTTHVPTPASPVRSRIREAQTI